MSIADAKRAVDIGATAIMVSNRCGRQLDGSRSPFDQLAEIVDAVGDRCDLRRRRHPWHPRLEGPFRGRKGMFGRENGCVLPLAL
jgi:FMN-dependent dehydrogenase